ncbi:hypothetical protein LI165_13310, partial [Phascolarctobacterium faecium]|uniref:hypothetical protein n=1 Tax=Phascolarctobacterium faecium TaxID=33025 RepID=UPI001D098809
FFFHELRASPFLVIFFRVERKILVFLCFKWEYGKILLNDNRNDIILEKISTVFLRSSMEQHISALSLGKA